MTEAEATKDYGKQHEPRLGTTCMLATLARSSFGFLFLLHYLLDSIVIGDCVAVIWPAENTRSRRLG